MLDILLHLDTYPDPTSAAAIEQAVRFSAAVDGTLTALAVEISIRPPNNRLADRVVGLSGMAVAEEKKSQDAGTSVLGSFTAALERSGVIGRSDRSRVDLYAVGDHVAERSRTHDLCIIPVINAHDGQRAVIEAVVFGAGRPVLAYCPGLSDLPPAGLGSVVLAWDGTRTAARALSDALPVLMKAREVRVLTVTREKPSARPGLGAEAARYLTSHGANVVVDEIDGQGRRIGPVFETYVADHGSDLIVMGAYGHSRAREFILGGATQHMLHDLKVPILLSH